MVTEIIKQVLFFCNKKQKKHTFKNTSKLNVCAEFKLKKSVNIDPLSVCRSAHLMQNKIKGLFMPFVD